MNCKKCGNILNAGATACPICGEPVNNEQPINNMNNMNTPMSPTPMPEQQPMQQPLPEQQPMQPVQQPMQQPMQQPPMNPGVQQPMQPAPGVQAAPVGMAPEPAAYNNPAAMQTNVAVPKKSNLSTIIIIILVIAIIAVGAFLFSNLNKENKSSGSNKSTTTTSTTNDKEDEKDNDKEKDKDNDKDKDKNQGTGNQVGATTKKTYKKYGFTFTIPEGVDSEETSQYLLISTKDYQYQLSILTTAADLFLEDPQLFLQGLEANGYEVVDYDEKTYDGHKYIIANIYVGGYPYVAYATKLADEYVAYGYGVASTTSAHNKGFKVISNMISSVQETSTFAPSEEDKNENIGTSPEFNLEVKEKFIFMEEPEVTE